MLIFIKLRKQELHEDCKLWDKVGNNVCFQPQRSGLHLGKEPTAAWLGLVPTLKQLWPKLDIILCRRDLHERLPC
jgi:hypothetical protein